MKDTRDWSQYALVVQLRAVGMTFAEIGSAIGLSVTRASQMYCIAANVIKANSDSNALQAMREAVSANPVSIDDYPTSKAKLKKLSPRDRIMLLEREMLKRPQVECPVVHRFAKGLYIRELHVAAGVLSTGKIHKYEHVGMLLKGVRDMVIDGEVMTVTAPFTAIIKAGEKLACYTWEPSIYATVHLNPDDERDIPTLEKRLVCDTEEEYQMFLKYGQRLEDCRRGHQELRG